jgi:succinate dehydrogenase / fumarate reductase cytochrome b subunit
MPMTDNLFWRRLHSFMGVLPLGVFLLFHLYENSYSLTGPIAYDGHVRDLRSLPYLHFLEITFIYIPLLYHSLYGLYIWYTGKNNFPQYGYARNGLYTLQRLTGLIAFIFVYYHIYDQRLQAAPGFVTVEESIGHPVVFIIYFIGIAAVAFHLWSGVWNSLVKWGVIIGKGAQRAILALCMVLGLGLIFVGLRALTGFMR